MESLPRGTVTFLFTDIEGSTALWEQHPEAMPQALARHDTMLRAAIERHGGYVFKLVGDAFCAAFATAPEALRAALEAQRALTAEPWGGTGPLRVRMALHTGVAELREGDYTGPVLNRVARLLAAGHGGQVLLSAASQELVRDDLPDGTGLRDMGQHRLRDLTRPEHIYQPLAPDLPADFPVLKTLDVRRANLPIQPTPFMGRQAELRAVCALLQRDDVRLLTLTGPGGIGKTRLALQVAAELLDDYPDGVCFVDLAPLRDPQLVSPSIMVGLRTVLGLRETGDRLLDQLVYEELRSKRVLLLLDNFEQLLAAAPMLAELLMTCPRLKLLVTSRVVLRLRSEQEFSVPAMALPDRRQLPPLERLTQYEALWLFIERARAVDPAFAVTSQTAPAIAEICHRLDGLPLAIELAAARTRVLSPEQLLARLSQRLQLLTGGPRDLPARQQTLRNTIGWSYSLLTPAQQRLFALLGVFAGGCSLEAVEAVCQPEQDLGADITETLSTLVEQSVLRQEHQPDGIRFSMLELVREYALEQLEQASALAAQRERHARYYLQLAEQVEQRLQQQTRQAWLPLERDHDNLRAALRWALESRDAALALALCAYLGEFWAARGHLREARRWMDAVLAMGGGAIALRSRVLYHNGWLAMLLGEYATAQALHEQNIRECRAQGHLYGEGQALNGLGAVAHEQGDYERALLLFEQAAELWRTLGDVAGSATSLNNLGWVALAQGQHAKAETLFEACLVLRRQLGNQGELATGLVNLGWVALARGDTAQARPVFEESLRIRHAMQEPAGLAECLEGLAGVAVAQGSMAQAARLCGAVQALRNELGLTLSSADRDRFAATVQRARQELGPDLFAQAWAAGQALPLEQAVAEALQLALPPR